MHASRKAVSKKVGDQKQNKGVHHQTRMKRYEQQQQVGCVEVEFFSVTDEVI